MAKKATKTKAEPKLTATTAKSAKPDPSKRRWLFDGGSVQSIKGLGLAIQPSGSKSWWFAYRLPGQPSRRARVGDYPATTLDAARVEAAELARQVAAGVDPIEAKRAAAAAKAAAKAGRKTVADLAKRYAEEHAAVKKAKTSQANDELLWRLHILPVLGHRDVRDVAVADVADLHHALRGKPVTANRVLSLLSKAFNLAARWGWRDPDTRNPADGKLHDKYAEKSKKRGSALTAEQLRRVGEALQAMPPSTFKDAFLFYVLTGCRPHDEAATLRWDAVDLDGRTVHLAASKTGPRSLTLSAQAVRVLAGRPRVGDFVFPSDRREGQPISTLRYIAEKVREAADLPETTRPYDQGRHTFISWAKYEAGIEERMAKQLCGHADASDAHERYTHAAPKHLIRAADKIGDALQAALFGAEDGALLVGDFGRRAG